MKANYLKVVVRVLIESIQRKEQQYGIHTPSMESRGLYAA